MPADASPNNVGLKARLVEALRSKPSRTRLTKRPPPGYSAEVANQDGRRDSSASQAHRGKYKDSGAIDSQLGERRDHTTLLHSLGHRDSFDSIKDGQLRYLESRRPGEQMIASLSPHIWEIIEDYITPSDAANLAFSSKTLRYLLGSKPWEALGHPENRQYRIDFLLRMDGQLPSHLFCFSCATYHLRIQRGQERLKAPNVPNPLFNCPNAYNYGLPPPRTRLTPGRTLPFAFVQLALRAQRYSLDYGITFDSLSRRWKQDGWSHLTRYFIHKGHLLLRVISSCFAPPGLPPSGLRLLLYSREDYTPYFSVCAHWRDGKLMNLCKCALNHIPRPRDESGPAGLAGKVRDRLGNHPFNSNALVSLCSECRPMRRCPECPTEYLIEIRLMEDKTDNSFKRAIVVTRWSDLGDGTSPLSSEWAACNGEVIGYDSFAAVGNRAISGTFESHYTEEHIPGQRILSMNPEKEKRGEAGHDWY